MTYKDFLRAKMDAAEIKAWTAYNAQEAAYDAYNAHTTSTAAVNLAVDEYSAANRAHEYCQRHYENHCANIETEGGKSSAIRKALEARRSETVA